MKLKLIAAIAAALFVGAVQADVTVVGSGAAVGGIAGQSSNAGWFGSNSQQGGVAASGAAVGSTAVSAGWGPVTGGFTASGATSRQSTYGGSYVTGVGNPFYNGSGSYGVQQSSTNGGTISGAF